MAQAYEPRSQSDESAIYGGRGWVLFSGIMIGLVGVMNVIYGIAAIDNSAFFVQDARYVVFQDLSTWGWLLLVVGAVQVIAAFGIWARTAWGRWIGLITASGNAILQLLFLPSFPLAALALFAIDLLVIYGLSWAYRDE